MVVGRIQERAAREDAKLRERLDLRDALLDLLHLLRQWQRCAEMTNYLALLLIDEGQTDADSLDAVLADQQETADDVLRMFGWSDASPRSKARARDPHPDRRGDRAAKASASDVLFVYAPELEEGLRRAMLERRGVVASLEDALSDGRQMDGLRRAFCSDPWEGADGPTERY